MLVLIMADRHKTEGSLFSVGLLQRTERLMRHHMPRGLPSILHNVPWFFNHVIYFKIYGQEPIERFQAVSTEEAHIHHAPRGARVSGSLRRWGFLRLPSGDAL